MRELNAAQLAAVEHEEGPLLVVAGAGSGKTTVITERIRSLIRRGIAPDSILGLTFTDRAAREMKHRVRAALPDVEPDGEQEISISTFHSFCYQLLKRQYFDRQLLDKVDLWIFLRRRIEKLELELYQKLHDPGEFLHDLSNFFSRCQDELIEPEDFEKFLAEQENNLAPVPTTDSAARLKAAEQMERRREIARTFRISHRLLEEANCVSLGSLINEVLRVFDREPEFLAEYQQKFRYLLVDEFQDTNLAQIRLLSRIVVPPNNVTVVGDDDQAIYRFRGASYGSFQLFGDLYPDHRTIFLVENYRSTMRILRVAESAIAQNGEARYPDKKALVATLDDGEKVFLVEAPDFHSEAFWISDEVERLHRQGRPLGEMAVLYRSHSYRDLLVKELSRRKIPFSIRKLSILSATILRDLSAYLEAILRPHSNISLIRLLMIPRWRLPEDLAWDLRKRAMKNRRSLYAEILEEEKTLLKTDLDRTGWADLKALLKQFSERARRLPVTALVEALLDRLEVRLLPDYPDHRYLTAFMEFLAAWEEKSETRRLGEFLEYLDYFRQAGGTIEAPASADPSHVLQLMSVHGAKGLEFPVVFLLGVARGRFPHRAQKSRIEFPDELIRGALPPGDFHLQEETRLFYVGLTRAQRQLYVCSTIKRGKKPSVFIENLTSNGLLAGKDLERIEVAPVEPGAVRGVGGNGEPSAAPALGGTDPEGWLTGRLIEARRNSPYFYPDLAGWVRADPPKPLPEKLLLSASAVETYKACPLKFKMGHYLKVPTGPHPALTFGTVMHSSIRKYFEKRGEMREDESPSWDWLRQTYESGWRKAGFQDAYQEEAYKKAGHKQLRAFWERHRDADTRPLGLERRFKLELGDIILEGRIDQINLLGRNEHDVELLDYKTGSPRDQKDAERSLQLSLYALAARREMKLNPQRLTFYNLTTNEAVSAVRTEKSLEIALSTLQETAEEIRRGNFEPRPGFICKYCDFHALCPAQEQNP